MTATVVEQENLTNTIAPWILPGILFTLFLFCLFWKYHFRSSKIDSKVREMKSFEDEMEAASSADSMKAILGSQCILTKEDNHKTINSASKCVQTNDVWIGSRANSSNKNNFNQVSQTQQTDSSLTTQPAVQSVASSKILKSKYVQTKEARLKEDLSKKIVLLQVSKHQQTEPMQSTAIPVRTKSTAVQTSQVNNCKDKHEHVLHSTKVEPTFSKFEDGNIQKVGVGCNLQNSSLSFLPSLPIKDNPVMMQPVLQESIQVGHHLRGTESSSRSDDVRAVVQETLNEEKKRNKNRLRNMTKPKNLKVKSKPKEGSGDSIAVCHSSPHNDPLECEQSDAFTASSNESSATSHSQIKLSNGFQSTKSGMGNINGLKRNKSKKEKRHEENSKLENGLKNAREKLDAILGLKEPECFSPAYKNYQAGNSLRWKQQSRSVQELDDEG